MAPAHISITRFNWISSNIFGIKGDFLSQQQQIVCVEYPTHHYMQKYVKTHTYCPHCGKLAVWSENGPGDYYVGETHLCVDCKTHFTIQFWGLESDHKGIIEQIETGKTKIPTTQKGS